MNSIEHRRFLPLALLSILVILLTAAPAACAPQGEKVDTPTGGETLEFLPPAMVTLKIFRDEASIDAHPDPVRICKNPNMFCPGEVRWLVPKGLKDGEVLHIQGKSVQCFPGEPLKIYFPANSIHSGEPTCPAGTDWEYKVWLTKNGATIASVDPEVIIRGGGERQ
ncbi:MAG: hypothetical protein OEM62_11285 [Acidobacteriota bacterium]|nr:hypothetical protein [Acidobacteriota bacterium]